ncbi:hypothetical protein LJ737_13475 [Hymenobacter sp. 15J16-1T3B]|uniref:hypothetical protein n=1 Tax=Hymenobacter sp. 15J16-1T3B TaxID=2886941 RepID=UPI001D1120A6|nr:hypothetical protein [Hymenobacter sp. 15J16-1T3B]MCC3158253.1 hypothetical protein [Hymenobacter sp. 15J16-1T3B]
MKASVAPVVLAGAIGLLRWRQLPRTLRYLVALTWLTLLTEAVSRLLWWQHRPNLFLQPIFAVGEFGLLVLLYRQELRSAAFARVAPWLVGGFSLYILTASFLTADLASLGSTLRVVESVMVLGILGLYFRKLLNELTVEHLEREPMFWVSLGLLLYFLGDVHIFLFSNFLFLNYSKEFNLTVWAIHAVLYMVLYCCISLALWLPRKK